MMCVLLLIVVLIVIFFCKQKTAYEMRISDWSSDVCSSDLWLHDFGLQTSRGFRALKVWMALKEHGVAKFGRLIDQDLAHARYLTEQVMATPDLEVCFPTTINIVCFRYDQIGRASCRERGCQYV